MYKSSVLWGIYRREETQRCSRSPPLRKPGSVSAACPCGGYESSSSWNLTCPYRVCVELVFPADRQWAEFSCRKTLSKGGSSGNYCLCPATE